MKNAFASKEQLDGLLMTSSIDELNNFIRAIERRVFPPIGLITSPPGYGKTMAVAYLAENEFTSRGIGPQSSTLLVTIPTLPTNLAIAQAIAEVLDERMPNSRESANSLSEKICEKLIGYGIERIFLDEANRLRKGTSQGSFDFIRMLYETLIREDAQIAFFLIGLPTILNNIRKEEQFASRTFHHSFSALEQDEVLQYFLPNLKIDGWHFDPQKEAHLEMGSKLWESTKPSLRRLVSSIESACLLNIRGQYKLSFRDLTQAAIDISRSLLSKNDDLDPSKIEALGQHEVNSDNRSTNRIRSNGSRE